MIIKRVIPAYFLLLFLTGCSLQMVAPYDLQTVSQIAEVEKKIDYLYRSAELLPESDRQYEQFAQQYTEIDVDIRALLRRQQRRDKNTETIKQVDILLDLWTQDRNTHQEKDSLSTFIIKRRLDQYQRMFTALIKGENAKK